MRDEYRSNKRSVSPILIPVVLVRPLTGSRVCLEIPASDRDTILQSYPGWVFE